MQSTNIRQKKPFFFHVRKFEIMFESPKLPRKPLLTYSSTLSIKKPIKKNFKTTNLVVFENSKLSF